MAFVRETTGDRWSRKGPVTRNFFLFDDVIMERDQCRFQNDIKC